MNKPRTDLADRLIINGVFGVVWWLILSLGGGRPRAPDRGDDIWPSFALSPSFYATPFAPTTKTPVIQASGTTLSLEGLFDPRARRASGKRWCQTRPPGGLPRDAPQGSGLLGRKAAPQVAVGSHSKHMLRITLKQALPSPALRFPAPLEVFELSASLSFDLQVLL